MANLLTIYRRECAAYFNSPIAYIVIVVFLIGMSAIFFPFLGFFGQPNPDFRIYFEHPFSFAFFSILIIPAVTMRLWCEEKKQGTIEVLLTLPIKSWEVVMAKFLAGYSIVALALILTLTVPLSLWTVLDNFDWGAILTMYVGIILISGIYVALGACVSALTENQIVALLMTVLLTAIICFMGYPFVMNAADQYIFDGLGSFLGRFGTFFHYQNFAKGLLSPVDFIYSFSMMALFLILNNIFVEGRKY